MPRSQRKTSREKITEAYIAETETKQNGRPIIDPSGEKRSKQISVFLTPSLYRRLNLTARARGEKVNDIINRLLDDKLPTSEKVDEVEAIMRKMTEE